MLEQVTSRIERRPHESVTPEHFSKWKADPVTRQLFDSLIVAALDQFDQDLPETPELAIPVAYQREGARKMLDLLFSWEPESVKQDRMKQEARYDA